MNANPDSLPLTPAVLLPYSRDCRDLSEWPELPAEDYEHLLRLNAGFDQAIQSLAALRKHGAFQAGVLARFDALSKETRAAVTSYIVGVIQAAETDEAGRRFRERKAQERADEQEI